MQKARGYNGSIECCLDMRIVQKNTLPMVIRRFRSQFLSFFYAVWYFQQLKLSAVTGNSSAWPTDTIIINCFRMPVPARGMQGEKEAAKSTLPMCFFRFLIKNTEQLAVIASQKQVAKNWRFAYFFSQIIFISPRFASNWFYLPPNVRFRWYCSQLTIALLR